MYGNEQLFATKYKLYLPTKEELKVEIEIQKAMFYLQQQDSKGKETEQRVKGRIQFEKDSPFLNYGIIQCSEYNCLL